MSLSGQLSDLSLAELIEFFCNQHKTGRLKIAYAKGPGYFYFQNGALVDAKIGVLNGVDAVYYALTLENASFKFNTAFAPAHRSIHQPWAQVALEGLRRMDEGIESDGAFPEGYVATEELDDDSADSEDIHFSSPPSKSGKVKKAGVSSDFESASDSLPMSMMVDEASNPSRNKAMIAAACGAAVVLLIAAIGIPAGWYSSKKSPAPTTETTASSPSDSGSSQQQPQNATPSNASPDQNTGKKEELTDAAKREREKAEQERKKREQELKKQQEAKNAESPKPEQKGPKTVTVTVTYDEAGRVTSVSGDAAAARQVRNRRFPAGKAGSATISVPVQ